MPYREEELVAFPSTLADEPQATHCRGTLILASRRTLQARGYFDAYRAHLATDHETAIASSVAGMWVPIEVGVAHYRACDMLDLPEEEQLSLGAAVVHELQRTFIGTVLRAAGRGIGISPLIGLEKFFGVYARTIKGGGGRLTRIAPKDARVEFVGLPFADIHYFRVAYRGFISAGCEFFARRVAAAELAAHRSPTTIAYRIAWA
jgi:hypothetical protein